MKESDRIEEIEQRITVLQEEIAALETEKHELRMDIAGVRPGDIVIVTQRGREPFEVRVDRVDARWQEKPWIHGFKRKKDGEWGSQSQRYYSDWKKVA